MYFPKSLVLGIVSFVLVFTIGLLLFIYFQGGVDWAIRLRAAIEPLL
jgi:hypothetical protein